LNFSHGGDIFKFSKEIGCDISEVIDLSSNINFLKPKIDIDFNSIDVSYYPNYKDLENSIAKFYGVDIDEIELFNGATVAIYSLFRFLNLKRVYLYSPIYLEYKRCAILNSLNLNLINRFENLYRDIEKDSFVVFTNPSTPDGKYYSLDRLIEIWIEKEATIIIDESFLDFTEFKSAVKFLDYKRLYIIKSMTKFFSSAGVRVGAIISNGKNISNLKRFEPIWKISQFDLKYIKNAILDGEFIRDSKEINRLNRLKLEETLREFSFIDKIYKSDVNFLLIRLRGITAKELQDKLKRSKIMVRDCSNFDFLDSSYIRVAIKSKEYIEILKEALCKI